VAQAAQGRTARRADFVLCALAAAGLRRCEAVAAELAVAAAARRAAYGLSAAQRTTHLAAVCAVAPPVASAHQLCAAPHPLPCAVSTWPAWCSAVLHARFWMLVNEGVSEAFCQQAPQPAACVSFRADALRRLHAGGCWLEMSAGRCMCDMHAQAVVGTTGCELEVSGAMIGACTRDGKNACERRCWQQH
jgi:hypothetical protein